MIFWNVCLSFQKRKYTTKQNDRFVFELASVFKTVLSILKTEPDPGCQCQMKTYRYPRTVDYCSKNQGYTHPKPLTAGSQSHEDLIQIIFLLKGRNMCLSVFWGSSPWYFFVWGVGGLWSTFTLFSCFARKAWTDYCIKHAEHTEQPYGSEALAAVEPSKKGSWLVFCHIDNLCYPLIYGDYKKPFARIPIEQPGFNGK